MPATAAKSAFRLVGSSSAPARGMPRDRGGVRADRAVAAEPGTLPTTGLDLEGMAVVAIGFVMAGGTSLLASRRLRKRQRNG
jgi:LPXTG-motif cell wall-anchored protein